MELNFFVRPRIALPWRSCQTTCSEWGGSSWSKQSQWSNMQSINLLPLAPSSQPHYHHRVKGHRQESIWVWKVIWRLEVPVECLHFITCSKFDIVEISYRKIFAAFICVSRGFIWNIRKICTTRKFPTIQYIVHSMLQVLICQAYSVMGQMIPFSL